MPSPRPSSATGSDPAAPPQDASQEANRDRKDAPFYCPGCGKRVEYQQQCQGKPESPHPPMEVVSTDELYGADYNPDAKPGESGYRTPAPSTENLG